MVQFFTVSTENLYNSFRQIEIGVFNENIFESLSAYTRAKVRDVLFPVELVSLVEGGDHPGIFDSILLPCP